MAQGSGYVSMARPPHLEEVVDPGNEPLLLAEVLHQADRAPAGPLHTLLKPYSSAPRRRGGSDRSTAWGRRPRFRPVSGQLPEAEGGDGGTGGCVRGMP